MRHKASFWALLLTAVLGFQLLQAASLEETFKKRIDAKGFDRVRVQNVNGSIEVSSWAGDEIEIIAYKKVRADDAERAGRMMEALTVEVTENGGELNVETVFPKGRRGHSGGFFSWLFGGGSSGSSVSYEIKVPKKMNLDLHSTNGALTVTSSSGEMVLGTTNGKIRAEDISGTVRARTTNGSLNISMKEVTKNEEMNLKTTNGSVKLYLPSTINADIEARTTNGRIRCELPLSEGYNKSKRRLDGEINNGGPLIYIKTTNGSVSILEY